MRFRGTLTLWWWTTSWIQLIPSCARSCCRRSRPSSQVSAERAAPFRVQPASTPQPPTLHTRLTNLYREAHPSHTKTPKLTACVVWNILSVSFARVGAIALTCRAYVAVLIVDSVKPKQGRLDHLLRSHGPTPWNFWAPAPAPWPPKQHFYSIIFVNVCIFILVPQSHAIAVTPLTPCSILIIYFATETNLFICTNIVLFYHDDVSSKKWDVEHICSAFHFGRPKMLFRVKFKDSQLIPCFFTQRSFAF